MLGTIPAISKSLSAETAKKAGGKKPDITYKTVDGLELKLDLYQPLSGTPDKFPVMVYIHGGGWAMGDKSEIHQDYRKDLMEAFLAKGYAVISIDYRLTDLENTHFPAPLIDCKDAVRWIYKHADHYQLDADQIGLWGSSAGANLALLIAYSADTDFSGDAELSGYPAKVKYVLNHYGPVDLNKLFRPKISNFILWLVKKFARRKYELRQSRLSSFSGMDLQRQKAEVSGFIARFSPVNYISAGAVPTFTIHGDHDETVPVRQARLIDAMLAKFHVQRHLIIYAGEGHGLKTLSQDQIRDLIIKTLVFTASACRP